MIDLEAGQLNKKVVVQEPQYQDNDRGERVIVAWKDIKPLYASIHPLTSKELERAKQAKMDTTHRITIRYNRWIRKTHRLKYENNGNTNHFLIQGIIDPELAHVELQLDTVETIG